MWDKKQVPVIFLFKFEMVHKAVETTGNINNNNRMRSAMTGRRKLTTAHERITEADPLTTTQEVDLTREVAKELDPGIWSKLGRWKISIKWVPYELTASHKNCQFCSVIFYSMQQQRTISQSDGDVMKRGFDTTTGDDQLSGWTEKVLQSTSQGQIYTKEGSRSLFGGLLPVWATIAFWTQQNHYIWAVCSAGQWGALNTAAPAACIGQQNGLRSSPRQCPTTRCTTSASNAEWIGLWHFPSSTAVTWPLTNWWPLLQASQQHFAGKMLPQPVGCRKCIPRVCQIPEQGFLCYRNKQTSFSLAKMCWL